MSGLPDMMQDEDAYKNMQFLKVVKRKPDFPRSSKNAKKKTISEGRKTKGQIFCG